jgi:hypothetical protein
MGTARAILAGALLLVLAACSKGLAGSYRCAGIPDITTLTLEGDGRYTSTGNILGHAISGAGRYKADARRVRLEGSYKVEGLTLTEPSEVVFDRKRNGDLKSLLTSCKKS